MDTLGDKIKELRKSRDLTQQDLADILGITRGQISNLEKNRRSLSLDQLRLLCSTFNLNLDYFMIQPDKNEAISLLEKAKLFFESNQLSEQQKDELYQEIMRIYLNHKSR